MWKYLLVPAAVVAIVAPHFACAGAAADKAASSDSGNGFTPSGGGTDVAGFADAGSVACFENSECATGLVCMAQMCVAGDSLPPEQKSQVFQQPITSANFVFALSSSANLVAVIDPNTLGIRTVPVPTQPYDLKLIPGQDAVVIVSLAGESVEFLTCTQAACTLQAQPTARQYPAVSVSGDGLWAVLWTPDGQNPSGGAEGVVGLVDLTALASGPPSPIIERAAGRRQTNVFFRMNSGKATDAVMVGMDTVDDISLASLATQLLPASVPVATDFFENDNRNVIVSPDGNWIMFGALSTNNVGIFDVAAMQFDELPMPGPATDVELTPDGKTAVVVLRSVGEVAWFPLPGALTDPTAIQFATVVISAVDCTNMTIPDAGPSDGGLSDGGVAVACPASVGQASLSNDGSTAVLFTNARPTESFATLNLASGQVSTFTALVKLVYSLGMGPDGHSVMVLHTPGTTTSTDVYEQMVAASQGFSVVDLDANVAQLTLTNAVPPQAFVFSGDAQHAAVTLSDTTHSVFGVDAVDLQTLVTSSLTLSSPPQFTGAFPGTTPFVWVTEVSDVGQISFINLSSLDVRTATGYALNGGD